jgi:hypothetical protein
MMWMKVAIVALVLWWWSQHPAHASKAASGDVELGDGDVNFVPDDGEWNPFYLKQPSLDLETPGAGGGRSASAVNPDMAALIDESDAAIRKFDAENPPLED